MDASIQSSGCESMVTKRVVEHMASYHPGHWILFKLYESLRGLRLRLSSRNDELFAAITAFTITPYVYII